MTISLFVYLSLNEMKESFVVVINLNLRLLRICSVVGKAGINRPMNIRIEFRVNLLGPLLPL